MSMPLEQPKLTYRQYLRWPEGARIELIDGDVYNMTPAPSRMHQKILMALGTKFATYLRGKTCEVYPAPFDVRLPKPGVADEDTDTVVQPDITVVCDVSKLDDRGCKGPPDLVVEIISPGSLKLDISTKKSLYEASGVKEYWIVYPSEKIVTIYTLSANGKYETLESYSMDDAIPVSIFPDFVIHANEIWA
ncbi:Uma2 family endonuclease [Cohnella cellulosilytica]|uniref:Uma2 family endonuclease n=1 Tax=Cohnella cellulosilytica TaxID=986710 RepID=A0ABW2FJJ0_9BACL